MKNADLINLFLFLQVFMLINQKFPKKIPSYILIIYTYYTLEEQ